MFKKIALTFILFISFCSPTIAADTKVSALAAPGGGPAAADKLYLIDDPAGTPASKADTIQNVVNEGLKAPGTIGGTTPGVVNATSVSAGTLTVTGQYSIPTAKGTTNQILGMNSGADGTEWKSTLTGLTFSGFTATRPVYSDASGNLVAGDNGGHLKITGGDYEIKDDVVNSEHYAAGSVNFEHLAADAKFTSYAVAGLSDTTTPSVLTVTETTNTCVSNYKASGADHVFTMPAAHAAGNIIFMVGDEFQVDVEPDTDDLFYLNGTAMAANEHIENDDDTLGERLVCYTANINGTLRWMCYSGDTNFAEALRT